MKKFITLLILLCTVIGAKAALTVTRSADGTVTLHTDYAGQIGNNLDNNQIPWQNSGDKELVINATSLKLDGPFNNDDFLGLAGKLNNLQTLDLRSAEISESQTLSGNLKNNLVTLYMPTSQNYTSIATQFCNGATKLVNLTLGDNIKEIGVNAFNGDSKLTGVVLPKYLEYIREDAFNGTDLKEISIPGTVKRIGTRAFVNCYGLTKVIFEEATNQYGESIVNMHIEELAFRQAENILDVYVNTMGIIECENKAFDFKTTFGQSNVTAPMATLHYPESKIEDYVNLNHVLTYEIAANAGAFQAWLVEHFNRAASDAHNGWYEFVNTGAKGKDPDPTYPDKFLMTYSFYTEVKPLNSVASDAANSIAQLLPNGVRAYIVDGIEKETTSSKTSFKLHLKRVLVIPPNTGVILYGETNSRNEQGQPTLSLTAVGYRGMPLSREIWENEVEYPNYMKNYLVGTANSEDKPVHVRPFETAENNNNEVTFRNFGMGRFKSTDSGKEYVKNNGEPASNYVGFFRLKESDVKSRKAYLRLRATEYDNPDGGEAIVLKDENYYLTYTNSQNPTLSVDERDEPYNKWSHAEWDADWGVRNSVVNVNDIFVKFVGEPIFNEDMDEATLILEVEKEDNDNSYYTLQGLRVANPTKSGIYIKNGKKIYVK